MKADLTPEQTSDLLEIATTLSLASRLLYDYGLKHLETPRVAAARLGLVHSTVGLARRQLDLVSGAVLETDVAAVGEAFPHRD